MRKHVSPASLVVVLLTPILCVAQSADKSKVAERLISELDSLQFETREHARKELLKLREAALDSLKDAMKTTPKNLEHRRRIEAILGELAVYEREGKSVGGLRLRLNASNDTLRVGDQMTLIATLTNESKSAMSIRVGAKSADGWILDRGPTLHYLTDQLYGPELPKFGDKRKPSSTSLRAGQSLTFTTVVTLRRTAGKKYFLAMQNSFGESFLELPAAAIVRLRMVHDFGMEETNSEGNAKNARTVPLSGSVRSDDIDLKIQK